MRFSTVFERVVPSAIAVGAKWGVAYASGDGIVAAHVDGRSRHLGAHTDASRYLGMVASSRSLLVRTRREILLVDWNEAGVRTLQPPRSELRWRSVVWSFASNAFFLASVTDGGDAEVWELSENCAWRRWFLCSDVETVDLCPIAGSPGVIVGVGASDSREWQALTMPEHGVPLVVEPTATVRGGWCVEPTLRNASRHRICVQYDNGDVELVSDDGALISAAIPPDSSGLPFGRAAIVAPNLVLVPLGAVSAHALSLRGGTELARADVAGVSPGVRSVDSSGDGGVVVKYDRLVQVGVLEM